MPRTNPGSNESFALSIRHVCSFTSKKIQWSPFLPDTLASLHQSSFRGRRVQLPYFVMTNIVNKKSKRTTRKTASIYKWICVSPRPSVSAGIGLLCAATMFKSSFHTVASYNTLMFLRLCPHYLNNVSSCVCPITC